MRVTGTIHATRLNRRGNPHLETSRAGAMLILQVPAAPPRSPSGTHRPLRCSARSRVRPQPASLSSPSSITKLCHPTLHSLGVFGKGERVETLRPGNLGVTTSPGRPIVLHGDSFNSSLWKDPPVGGSDSPPWKRSRTAHQSDSETSRLGLNLLLS